MQLPKKTEELVPGKHGASFEPVQQTTNPPFTPLPPHPPVHCCPFPSVLTCCYLHHACNALGWTAVACYSSRCSSTLNGSRSSSTNNDDVTFTLAQYAVLTYSGSWCLACLCMTLQRRTQAELASPCDCKQAYHRLQARILVPSLQQHHFRSIIDCSYSIKFTFFKAPCAHPL